MALCADEAHAVRLSLDYAMRRFGQAQKDVAEQMGVARSRLSEWRKPERTMPEKHREAFVRATGCNLLAQHIEDVDARKPPAAMTRRTRSRHRRAITGAPHDRRRPPTTRADVHPRRPEATRRHVGPARFHEFPDRLRDFLANEVIAALAYVRMVTK